MGSLSDATRYWAGWGWLHQLLAQGSVTGNFVFYALSRLLGLVAIAIFLRGRKAPWRLLGFKRFKPWQAIGLLLLCSLLLLAITATVFSLLGHVAPGVNLDQ